MTFTRRRKRLIGLLLSSAAFMACSGATRAAAATGAVQVSVTIHADQPGAVINPNVYGQFAEHLGTGIYEGVWVGEKSSIPNTNGYRNDVIDALKNLHVPVVRWPGGCFADEYHWRDGIGDRAKRPVKVNTHWGGVAETNEFGTHEFMAFAEMIGTKVYISGNVGSGSPQEMADWMEYMTSDTVSTLANERRKNGRDKPWDVQFFGIGNETWGCGGNMTPEWYSNLFRQYATFIKAPRGKRPKIVASGGNDAGTDWVSVLTTNVHRDLDAISHHYYTIPGKEWRVKGKSTGFPESEWISTLAHTRRIDEYITNNVKILDKNDPQGKVAFYVDEWGTWYDPEPGREPGFLWQHNTLRDALVAGLNFNIFHAHAKRVQMTNIAQMVNVLQAMILTEGPKMALTPTYHVFQMYIPFQGATYLPTEITTPAYELAAETVPAVSVSAARDTSGRLQLALVNLDPNREAVVTTQVTGGNATQAQGRVLTARTMDARNTVEAPEAIYPVKIAAERKGSTLVIRLPPKSVSVLRLQ
ncbi:MAG TPA: alpha-L-arabinofuranosidase C-terminal domain-containing protein [Steroidobacteraceae bacterium]|nr:alpha-L-arabinofuranosidase C-terminal domain-containing protein [Steroidobacteraceae bacterium]